MKTLFRIAVAIALVALVQAGHGPTPASAQDPEVLDTHRDWHTYTYRENSNLVCYMVSQPTREEGEYSQRGGVFLMVTHRPADESRGVVNVITGYSYRPDSEATVTVGDSQFNLLTSEDSAWAKDSATDAEIIAAMKAGTSMTVVGTSSRDTRTTDTYSLLGFTAAYNQITQTCNL